MSGGSWEYLYLRLEDAANRLLTDRAPERRALGRHLQLMATALHDIEWVDSCDYGRGDDRKAIDAALGSAARELVLAEVVTDAKAVREQLDRAIDAASRSARAETR